MNLLSILRSHIIHQSFVTTASQTWGRAGDSRANEPCFFFYFYVKIRGIRYTQANMAVQCKAHHTVGETAIVLPACCPSSVGVIAGDSRQKVKVPAIPRGWGAWLQMTGALPIRSTIFGPLICLICLYF